MGTIEASILEESTRRIVTGHAFVEELAREMPTGCERSVLLMFAALSLFCIFGVCAGQLNLVLRRGGPERNVIRLTCFNDDVFEVPNATFYMRAPGAVTRMRVNETGSGLQDYRRDIDGAEITFTITPETEANFTCAINTTSENEASGLLVAGSYIRILHLKNTFVSIFYISFYLINAAFRPLPDNSIRNPPRTVFPGQTFELDCSVSRCCDATLRCTALLLGQAEYHTQNTSHSLYQLTACH